MINDSGSVDWWIGGSLSNISIIFAVCTSQSGICDGLTSLCDRSIAIVMLDFGTQLYFNQRELDQAHDGDNGRDRKRCQIEIALRTCFLQPAVGPYCGVGCRRLRVRVCHCLCLETGYSKRGYALYQREYQAE